LLTVLLAFVSPCLPQDIEVLQKGVVKIAMTTLEGKRKIGTGFIVRLGADVVYIVTASHVVEGARDIEVAFFIGRNRLIPAKVLDMEGGDPQGLAVLAVEGKIPTGISVLKMNRVAPVRAGDPVTMIGFPDAGAPWTVTKGEIVGRKGKTIAFSGAVDEGNSGGPLIKEGQVIGIVTETRALFAYAVPAVITQYVLESWGVKVGDQLRSRPATLAKGHIVQMIREKGFHHPGDLSNEGLSGSVRGNFEHEYALKTLNGDTVVIDHATGLMWQQAGSFKAIPLGEAKGYIDEVNREGYAGASDWRLPTVEELASLLEPIGENEGLYIDPMFDKNQRQCWSADESSESPNWGVDYKNGIVYYGKVKRSGDYSEQSMVRGVRSAQSDFQKGAMAPAPIPTSKEIGVGSQLANAKIAFVSRHKDNGEIHVMNADGSSPTRLTDSKAKVLHPVWSPDGTKIAFASTPLRHTDNGEIYVMNADGSNLRRLTDSEPWLNWPAWSPDGTKIAFALWRSCNRENYVMNADGSNRKRLPDIMRAGGSCSPSLSRSPAWSPDGTKIALLGNQEESPAIHVINADGTNLRDYGPMRMSNVEVWLLSWSPDGTKIAFAKEHDETGIYLMNADGTDPMQLSQARVAGQDDSGGLAWSPDGTKIAFVSASDNKRDIHVVNADGTNPRRLTKTPADNIQPAWSPDGTKIAFASHRYGNWEIYVMDADGTNPRRLTNPPADKQWPAWSPVLK